MSPIAIYNEVRFDGKRTFQLFEDRIIVHASAMLRGDSETALPLASLSPWLGRVRSRNRGFLGGFYLTLGSWILAYVIGATSQRNAFEVIAFFCALGIAGVALSLATAKKIEWVQFSTDAGVIVLTIARAGKEKDQFAPFVETLTNKIVAARSGN